MDGFRFMSTPSSSFVKNLSDGLYSDKCKDWSSCLDYMSVKDDQLIFKFQNVIKNYNKEL